MLPHQPPEPNRVAEVRQVEMTEQQLIDAARDALDSCNWTIGRLASEWKRRFAGDRTDADFAQLTGLDREHVRQRRAAWERFGGERDRWPDLTFTHYRDALGWDDADESLDWAQSRRASVREMKVWHAKREAEAAVRRGDLVPSRDEPEVIRRPATPDRTPEPEPPTILDADYTITSRQPAGTRTRPGDASGRQPDRQPAPAGDRPAPAQPERDSPRRESPTQTIGDVWERLTIWTKSASPAERTRQAAELAARSVQILPDRKVVAVVALVRAWLEPLSGLAADGELAAALARELRGWADRFGPVADAAGSVPDPDPLFALSSAPATDSELAASVTAHQTVVERWNLLGQFQRCASLTTKRRANLRARLSDPWWRSNWATALEILSAYHNGFLTGENDRGWKANFDWFIRPNTVTTIIEGQHQARAGKARSQHDRDVAFDQVFRELENRVTED